MRHTFVYLFILHFGSGCYLIRNICVTDICIYLYACIYLVDWINREVIRDIYLIVKFL